MTAPRRINGRSGSRARPGGGFELAVWYLMRLTGLGLFVLAISHFVIVHVLYDPADQTASFISERWANLSVRTADWLMLLFVVFHAFMGLRTIVGDYARGGLRTLLTMALYLIAIALFLMGTVALIAVDRIVPAAA
ncbi:MAG: succinate dehydrogenase / fumarate reductase, rane anchor subunit [Chloroflexota bacterium]|nr:succinate dehydrogenase / fumarate reductase, rane anchor subunit [Chloroflexota bacterium]